MFGLVLDAAVNGLALGSLYVLAGLGFAILYGVFKVLNFAHGDIVMVGGFFAWMLAAAFNMNYLLVILLTLVFCVILGLLLETSIFKPLRGGSLWAPGIAAMALGILLQNSARLIWGPEVRTFSTPFAETIIQFGGVTLTLQKVVTFAISLLLIGVVVYLVERTIVGKAIRAVSQDGEASRLMGINDRWIGLIVFGLAAGTAGAAGSLIVPLIAVNPLMGGGLLLKAFIIVILAGFNIGPVIFIGLALGVFESLAILFLTPTWVNSVAFVTMLILLSWRPTGVFPERLAENI